MKNKYILFLLLGLLFIILPLGVKADKRSCVYDGFDLNGNYNRPVDIIVDYSNSIIKVSGNNITYDSYKSLFSSSCPENIYLCTSNSSYNYNNIYTYRPTDCSEYIYLKLKSDNYHSDVTRNEDQLKENMTCIYLFGDPQDSNYAAYWMQWAFRLMKYLGIIALFVMSTIDFVKALVEKDQDAIKKAATTSVKRFIFCILLFFLPIIVDTLMSLVGAYGTCNIGG